MLVCKSSCWKKIYETECFMSQITHLHFVFEIWKRCKIREQLIDLWLILCQHQLEVFTFKVSNPYWNELVGFFTKDIKLSLSTCNHCIIQIFQCQVWSRGGGEIQDSPHHRNWLKCVTLIHVFSWTDVIFFSSTSLYVKIAWFRG